LLEKLKSIKSDFVRNVILVMTGTAVSQMIGLAVTPILTRNYSPKDFGILLIYISILTIAGTISTGKYERVILLLKFNSDIKRVVLLSLFISLMAGMFLLILTLTSKQLIVEYLSFDITYYNWIITIPFLLVVYSQYIVFSTLLNYQKNYKALSIAKVVKTLTSITTSLTCIILLNDARGLILGEILGYTFSFIYIFSLNRAFLNLKIISFYKIREVALRYKEFPIYNIPSDFMNMTSSQLPAFFLTTYFGTGVTGFYSLMKRVLDAPIGLLSTSVLEVFRQKAAEKYLENGNCKSLFIKTAKSLALMSLVPFILLFVYAPDLFSFLFGKEWRIAGDYSRIFTLYYYFKFISSPLTYMFYIAEKQRIDFLLHIYVFCSVIIILNLPKFINMNEIQVLLTYSINFVLIYIVYFIFSYELAKGNLSNNQTRIR
tara:strand:- start:10009 stop:11301 length:1293 start_codon:yes stop_codon:yes gene_type:complete